jgi:predicted nucleotidyltransferase
MIKLEQKYLAVILKILNQYVPNCEVRVFGSRITNNAKKYSDLDLVLIADTKIDRKHIEQLKDAFSESNLPISVDVIDWYTLSDEFKEIISKNYVVLRPKII